MQKISTVIPKVTPADFQKIMRSIGATRYDQISSTTIILFAPASSRNARKELLENLSELLKVHGAQYTSRTNISGSGHVEIPTTGGKIALKPERIAGGVILKPNIFGQGSIVDVNIPYGSYESTLISAIQNTKKLNDIQKELLISITESVSDSSGQKRTQLRKLLSTIGNQISINTINNDFGEVLGPIAIGKKNLLPIDFGSANVFIPGRSNEPLLDYKITDKNNIWKISAKSGTTTNTLKPSDVVMLINKEKFYKEKWKSSPQLKVLEMLDMGTTKQGPIDTAMWLKNNGYENYFDWLNTRDYTEEIRQKCEDTIVKISREAISFTEIFSDATTAKIYYIKFRMDLAGNMDWKLVETPMDKKDEKIAKKGVYFRSKNYVGRAKDKLGFQI